MANIGFVGLGRMGLPMAQNLVKNGHIVTGFDQQAAAMQAFELSGGKRVHSLAAVAQEQDIIITMLQTGAQVESVCLPEDGLFAQARPDTLYIDCSTIDIATAKKINQVAYGQHLVAIDAPVSGGTGGAMNGTLTFMVGGTEEAFLRAQPLLLLMGKQIIHTGAAGSGQAAKICNNMLLGAAMVAVSESFLLAEKLGLCQKKLFEVVKQSSGYCWVLDHYLPVPGILGNMPADHQYQPGFTGAMMLKDLLCGQLAAAEAEFKMPLAAQITQLYQTFNEHGGGQLDCSAIIQALREGTIA